MAFQTETMPQRIRTARILKGLSQGDFAREVQTAQSVVCRWETGKAEPRPGTLLKIATALGVSVWWLGNGGSLPSSSDKVVDAASAGVSLSGER